MQYLCIKVTYEMLDEVSLPVNCSNDAGLQNVSTMILNICRLEHEQKRMTQDDTRPQVEHVHFISYIFKAMP